MTPPPFGWYGDDFTGATDTLASLAQQGLRALLFLSQPSPAQLDRAGPLDAVGIAGASRAMAPAAMMTELPPIGRLFRDLGLRILQYKCCSTFDSAAEVGSIGAAVAALRPAFRNPFLPILGGQPSLGRYCLFSHAFAAAGTGGTVHRLDRHPTMRAHPVTPMTESDLRRHLAPQGLSRIEALHYPDYALPPEALDALLAQRLAERPEAMLLDVSRTEDLPVLGRLLWAAAATRPLLAVGPSSVAQALASCWPGGPMEQAPPALAPSRGPVFVMVGSLSPVSRQQVARATSYRPLSADAARLSTDPGYGEALALEACHWLKAGADVLVATGQREGTAASAAVASATAGFVARVVRQVPVARLGIAGGDTSSLAAQALDLWGLSYKTILAPGVTLCRGHSDDPALDGIELMLKGGQMGPPDLLEQFRARG
jgi:uncharacterized protein YgbK (DUF1537 family)